MIVRNIFNIRNDLDLIPNIHKPNDIALTVTNSFVEFKEISTSAVRKIINRAPAKTCNLDPIPTPLLITCLDVLLPTITNIVNLSLSTGIMPASLKTGLVVPILKKNNIDKEILKNYRPISLLPFLSKVIERCACEQIQTHFNNKDLYSRAQSAYRPNRGIETALLKVQNDLLCAMDNHQEAIIILLDMSAAFDTIDHTILLSRLQNRYGIGGTVGKWFTSYLNGRTQKVTISDAESLPRCLHHGVPQGSVLGAPLYTFYTGPLSDVINSHNVDHLIYADDTQVYLTFSPSERNAAIQKLENCVSDIKLWTTTNKLKLNDSKTEIIHITSKFRNSTPLPPIRIGDSLVQPVTSARNLGVTFDCHLNLKTHIRNICRSAWFGIHTIGKLRKYLDDKSTEKLAHAFVTSRLDFCNGILHNLPLSDLKKLQHIQNAAARIITRCSVGDNITPVLHKLHWLPIQSRTTFKVLLTMYKISNGDAPEYLSDLVEPYTPSRSLRSSSLNLYSIPRIHSKTYGEREFSWMGPSLWNALPDALRKSPTIDSFKRNLKTHLFNSAFYH